MLPTDGTSYPRAPVGNRHSVTLQPARTTARAPRGVEWTARRRRRPDRRHGDDHRRRRPHADRARAGQRRQLERLGRPHHHGSSSASTRPPPDRHHRRPDALAGRRGRTIRVTAADDIDGTGVDYVRVALRQPADAPGPERQQFTISDDGVHEIETRAIDSAGNASAWRSHTLRDRQDAADRHDRDPDGLDELAHRHAERHRRDVRRRQRSSTRSTTTPPRLRSPAATRRVTLPADGTYQRPHRVLDNAGQLTGWKDDDVQGRHGAPDQHERRRADDVADERALARADRHRRGVGRRSCRVARGRRRRPDRHARAGRRPRARRRSRRGSSTRPATRPTWRYGDDPGGHDQARQHDARRRARAWRKTNFTTTVTGTDATPGSGVARIEYKLDNGAVTTTPAVVDHRPPGAHKLESRVVDNAGNASDWRDGHDRHRQDRTRRWPWTAAATTWRNAAVTCNVAADGGESGLPTLTATRGGATADAIGGSYTVDGRRLLDRELPRRRRRRQRGDRDRRRSRSTARLRPPRHLHAGRRSRTTSARAAVPTTCPGLTALTLVGQRLGRDADERRRRVHRRQGHGRRDRRRRRRQHGRVRAGHARRPQPRRRRTRRRDRDGHAAHDAARPSCCARGAQRPPRA